MDVWKKKTLASARKQNTTGHSACNIDAITTMLSRVVFVHVFVLFGGLNPPNCFYRNHT